MKYLILSILIASIGGCGYGQFPLSKVNERGEIYNANSYTKTQFDSSMYYYKKESYYQKKMNAELNRLNRTGHANDISKSLLRYQDSAIFYKTLLDKLKSK